MQTEKEGKVTRNLPIKIVCSSTRHRIINQIIYEEFILSLWLCKKKHEINWANVASQRLKKYDIEVSPGVLKAYKTQIVRGQRDPATASKFGNGLFLEDYATRYGKDAMYKQFNLWRKFYTSDLKYIGLPANQILSIKKELGGDNITACEKNKDMYSFMFSLQRHFSTTPHAVLVNQDIFKYLSKTESKFSIFDFDLMCQANSPGLLETIVECVARTAKLPAVLNIVTTVGRWITDVEYRDLMPQKIINGLESKGLKVIGTHSDGYNDRIIPMRYEFLAIGEP